MSESRLAGAILLAAAFRQHFLVGPLQHNSLTSEKLTVSPGCTVNARLDAVLAGGKVLQERCVLI